MSETQGNGGAVATGEGGSAPSVDLLTRPFYGMRVSPRFGATHRRKASDEYCSAGSYLPDFQRHWGSRAGVSPVPYEGEVRPASAEMGEVVDNIRYANEIVPCLCCENPPKIRSNPTDAMKDATLYGTGMWKR